MDLRKNIFRQKIREPFFDHQRVRFGINKTKAPADPDDVPIDGEDRSMIKFGQNDVRRLAPNARELKKEVLIVWDDTAVLRKKELGDRLDPRRLDLP